jgi:hypothetical protein
MSNLLLRVQFIALFAFICLSSFAQEFRSTLSGRVLDPAGAAVVGAKVTATERETGAKFEASSAGDGEYTLPFLAPGPYTLTVEAPGFKAFTQTGLQVGTNQKLSQDVLLQVGSQTESVTVTSDVALLQTATASVGQVITSSQIENMPMNGRTALTLAQLAFGVTPASDPRFTRPFDNAGPSGFSMGGGQSQTNELLLDGAPDMTRNRRVAYNPPVDAVSEVKVEAFQPDAAYGNTAGGTVNVVMKGGTNTFHGSLYEFNQVSALKSTPFFTNAASQKKPVTRFNQYGGSIGGPIWIPKVINGKNKLFFFFTFEGIKQSEPEPTFATVATSAQRNGDFSQLPGILIYDPNSGVLNNGIITRTAFPGNVIPSNRISPIAKNILGYFPQPNATGTAIGQNNYFNNAVRSDNFTSYLGRFDYNVSDRHKLFFNMRNNDRIENRGNVYQNILTGNNLARVNWGMTFDDVYTLTPSFLMNTRLSWNRFNEGNSRSSDGFDFSSLGLPAYMKAASARNVFPRIAFQSYSSVGDSGGDVTPFDTFQIFENFTKITGKHNLKFGADLREQRESSNSFGNSSGNFAFNADWTKAASNAANAAIGQDMAGFLLGLPTGGNFQINATRTQQAKYFAFFVQDDLRARKNLNLNIGLRYEAETGTTERYDRATAGFNPSATLGVTAAAKAAYTAAPSAPLLPASAFNPVGGIYFAGSNGRTTYTPYKYNFSPRFGFSWTPDKLGDKTVIRGGIGLYVATFGTVQVQQPGFSQQTDLVSAGGGVFLTPVATLADPYPGGILRPAGNSRGVDTFVGQNVTYQERKFGSPITWRWNFNIQRAVGKNGVFEIGYIGSEARRIVESRDLNFVPNVYLGQTQFRDQAAITRLTTAVANPFRGLLPGTNLNGNTINQENLLRAYPQFNGNGGVRVEGQANGYSKFHMLQMRFERRFSSGLQFLTNYSFSKFTEATDRLNPGDAQLQYRIADEDRPHRFVFSGSYDLPFGKGKSFLSGVNGAVDRVVNGWQLNVIYTTQAGAPVDWSTNLTYFGGDLNWNGRSLTNTFDTTRFERVAANQPASNIRSFQRRYTAYRADKINNVDMSLIKNIRIVERWTLQFRCEAFNAFNRTNFNGPELNPTNQNFGRITSAANLPRVYQLALRLRF